MSNIQFFMGPLLNVPSRARPPTCHRPKSPKIRTHSHKQKPLNWIPERRWTQGNNLKTVREKKTLVAGSVRYSRGRRRSVFFPFFGITYRSFIFRSPKRLPFLYSTSNILYSGFLVYWFWGQVLHLQCRFSSESGIILL